MTTNSGQLSFGMRQIRLTKPAQPIPGECRNKYKYLFFSWQKQTGSIFSEENGIGLLLLSCLFRVLFYFMREYRQLLKSTVDIRTC